MGLHLCNALIHWQLVQMEGFRKEFNSSASMVMFWTEFPHIADQCIVYGFYFINIFCEWYTEFHGMITTIKLGLYNNNLYRKL